MSMSKSIVRRGCQVTPKQVERRQLLVRWQYIGVLWHTLKIGQNKAVPFSLRSQVASHLRRKHLLVDILKTVVKLISRSNADDTGKCPPGDVGKLLAKRPIKGNEDIQLSANTQKQIHEIYERKVALTGITSPVIIVRGEGVYLYDNLGNKYLDFTAGDSTAMLGHCHKKVAETISRHAHLLTQSTHCCQTVGLGVFSAYVSDLFGYDKVIPMNSGNEAVEAAIKLARKYGYKHKNIPENQAKIVVPENSYWGKSLAALATFSNKGISSNYGPHLPGFETVPFDDVRALEEKLKHPHVCGFLVEPIQAEAGIIIPHECYLDEVRRVCNENRVVLMADEVHVGLGRCGGLTCGSLFSMIPDILILGKSLSSGFLPVSATLANRQLMSLVDTEVHGSTFGGFQLGCIVSVAALEALIDEKLITNSKNMGIILQQALEIALPKECVKCIRGKGLLYAIELNGIFKGIVSAQLFYDLMCNGLIIRPPHDGIIRLCPPLCIKENQVIHAVKILRAALLKLRKYCTLTWEEIEQACTKRKNEGNGNGHNNGCPKPQGDFRKSTKRSQTHDNGAPCEDEELSARINGDSCKSRRKSKTSQVSCGDAAKDMSMYSSKSSKNQFYDDTDSLAEEFHNISSISKLNGDGKKKFIAPLTSTKLKKSESKFVVPDCADFDSYQQQFATLNTYEDTGDCPELQSPQLQPFANLKNKGSVSDGSCEPQKAQPCPSAKTKKCEQKSGISFDSSEAVGNYTSISDFPRSVDHLSDNSCEQQPINGQQAQCDDDDLPGRSTQCLCRRNIFSNDPNANNYLPYEVVLSSYKNTMKAGKPRGPTRDPCEEERAAKSKPAKFDDCAKKVHPGDMRADNDEKCAKKQPEVQECEKPTTSKQAEPCPSSKDESFECVPVSKRTDRGKNIVTSKGIQPIPKKSSAGKKFYPDDGQVPSSSKGCSPQPLTDPCKGQAEKSNNSKNDESKKSCNGVSKNSKPKS